MSISRSLYFIIIAVKSRLLHKVEDYSVCNIILKLKNIVILGSDPRIQDFKTRDPRVKLEDDKNFKLKDDRKRWCHCEESEGRRGNLTKTNVPSRSPRHFVPRDDKIAGSTSWLVVTSFTVLFLAIILCCSFQAHAEEAAELGEIRVEGASEQSVAEAPSSFATVIYPDQELVTFENLSEMLATTPGVTARSLGGLGHFSTVSIRGSSPEQVSVYLDGVKMNTASSGAFDFSTIPVAAIDRVEVIRGGGTAQFGADAIGGVINIITKKGKRGRSFEAFGGGGSFTTIKLGGSYLEGFKKNNLALSWTHLQSKGDYKFKTNPVKLSGAPSGIGGGQTFTRIHNAFLSESFLTNWSHKFDGGYNLSILNDFFFTNREVPGTEEETTILYPTNPLDAKERIFRNTNSIQFKMDKFFIKPLQFSLGVTNNIDIDRFKDATPALGGPIDTKTTNYSLGNFLKWDLILDHGFMTQIATLRYDYNFYYLTDSSPIPGTILTGKKTRQVHSVFIQDELGFLNDKIIFLPVFRFEDASDFSKNISFKTGLKVSPIKWLTVKSNFEKSFRYPSFNELYFPDQGYIRGNPNLQKEKAWNLDAGVEVNTKYASMEAVYFKNWVDNSIMFVPISATTIAPVNTFRVNTEGVETSLSVRPVKYIRANINYTYLKAHYASNNNQLPGRPKHEMNAKLEIGHDWNKKIGATLFGVYDYKGSVPINPSNTVFLAARSKLDLGVNVRFMKYYYLLFDAKNITNVQIYDARGFPLPRRSFFVTLGAKWS